MGSDDVSVLLGVGDGTFAAEQRFAAGNGPASASIEDLDGDGAPDLAVANVNSDDVSVLLGVGDGTFAAEQRFAAGEAPESVSIGDLDGDGIPDLAVANAENDFGDSDDVSVLLGVGDGTFAPEQRFAAGDLPRSVSIGDLDGDGAPDLAVVNAFSNDVSVLLNQSTDPADLDGDGAVGSGDLGILLAAWGGGDAAADLDGDGVVGSGDLGILLAAWGG